MIYLHRYFSMDSELVEIIPGDECEYVYNNDSIYEKINLYPTKCVKLKTIVIVKKIKLLLLGDL